MDNRKILLWASFLTLIAAGVGFAVRGGILGDWSDQFGFTKSELGTITGGGLTGFGLTIIICSLFIDRVGYKPLLVAAFILHVLSAVVTLAATPVYDTVLKNAQEAVGQESPDVPISETNDSEGTKSPEQQARKATYQFLFWGMFMFALANGLCEAAINPLVATLYPEQKTHYLNILHAGWPGGLIIGGLLAYFFVGREAAVMQLRWEISMAFFLIPTLLYGLMYLKEKFPVSEARAAGVSYGTMLLEFASPLLLFLFLLHAMVGYVELGTDSWIVNIMGNVIPEYALLLFVYTSGLMFVLRFFAGPIVERINPVGLLMVSAICGCVGLYSLGNSTAGLTIVISATIYGLGKTFLWPTMLGVVGERFPKGGALTMGTIGGIGMLSAGLLGGPGIGYKQDYFASKELEEKAPEVFADYKAEDTKSFLMFPEIAGLDGHKVGVLKDKQAELAKDETLTTEETQVLEADIFGGRMALKWTALIPFSMAIGYLILVIYFRAKGGYQVEVLHGAKPEGERYTGGVEGPIE